MKKNDLTLVVAVIIISTVISLLISNVLIGSPTSRPEKVEVVEPITAEFPTPDKRYFNDQSIDPTLLIKIGNDTNQQPFSQ